MMPLILLISLYFISDITLANQSPFTPLHYNNSGPSKNERYNGTISGRIPPLDEIQGVLKVAETIEGLAIRVLPLLTQATISLDQIISSVNPNIFGAVAGAFSSPDDGDIREYDIRQRQHLKQNTHSHSLLLDKIIPKK